MLDVHLFAGQLCNKLISRSILGHNFCAEDSHIYEDTHVLWNLFLCCEKIVYFDKHCYHYIMHNTSTMHTGYGTKCLSERKVAQMIIQSASLEARNVLPYAHLFVLRVEYDILQRAYDVRRKNEHFSC